RFLATSGTKGEPLPLRYTENELSNWKNLVARTLFTNTFDETDIVLFPVPISQFTGGFGMHEGLRKLNCGIITTGGMPTKIQVAILNGAYGVRPTAIVSIASYMFRIAEVAESQGIEPTSLGLKKASLGAEPWSEECRKKIEKRFGIKAYDSYGLGEVWGPGVAAECECDRNSMHGWEDYFHFEVIDNETGDILGENEWGELVITPLSKEAMPILRFRTGDKTKINGFECECGRTHIKINRITDRFDDLIFIRGLKIYPNSIEEMLHGIQGVGSEYQIMKPREDSSDPLKLVVEKDKNISVDDLTSIIENEFKKRFNHRPIVEVVDFGKIPRLPGKAKRILVAPS
ncbi:MAG: AMP-binding protein, partial [Candidatus Thorarchaeota archaeon]